MDFEAKAREIADSLDGNSDGDWPAHIAAALKAAYNQGLEDAAWLERNRRRIAEDGPITPDT